MKNSDYTIEIDGEEFVLQKEVWELTISLSKERDYYKDIVDKLEISDKDIKKIK